MGYIYLASPYSDASPNVMSARFVLACKVAGDWRFWANSCREIIGLASKLIVVRIPGWDESQGVTAEIAIALELGKPVEYMDLEGAGE